MKINEVLFAEKIIENRDAFITKLIDIAESLNISPNWLMLVFYIETNASASGSIDHKVRNLQTRATGLIQFMPTTAHSLGTTVDELMSMSNVDQLNYVERYLQPYAYRIKNVVDCYLAIFFPLAIGKPRKWVLETRKLSAEKVAKFNPLYDLNKDSKITIGEIERKLMSFIPKGFKL